MSPKLVIQARIAQLRSQGKGERRKNVASTKSSPHKGLTRMGGELS